MPPGDTRYVRWASSGSGLTNDGNVMDLSPFLRFSRGEWSRLRATAPLTLNEGDLVALQGLGENVSMEEVVEIYLPLARLLSLLSRGPKRPGVSLITTDGFLYPNRVLEERGLMKRKGFPESYDLKRLMRFMADVKAGYPEGSAPVYSHLTYDILPNEKEYVRQPEVLIVEGLNVLQAGNGHPKNAPPLFVSDFFDFSVYVDADEAQTEKWFSERFLTLRDTVFKHESSYFHRYAHLTTEEAREVAAGIWADINGVNLRENIAPTRERAHLILQKGEDHQVLGVRLRKL